MGQPGRHRGQGAPRPPAGPRRRHRRRRDGPVLQAPRQRGGHGRRGRPAAARPGGAVRRRGGRPGLRGRSVAGAYTLGNGISGTSQLVVDDARRVVVGATFTGPGLQELLHSATIAIVGQVPLDRLWHAVPSFPMVSEVWLSLLEAYGL